MLFPCQRRIRLVERFPPESARNRWALRPPQLNTTHVGALAAWPRVGDFGAEGNRLQKTGSGLERILGNVKARRIKLGKGLGETGTLRRRKEK